MAETSPLIPIPNRDYTPSFLHPRHPRPLPRASDEDRQIANSQLTQVERQRIGSARNINNSDLDFCEFQGQLIINYSWGNQQGVEHLAEAVYEGTEERFLRGWFPSEGRNGE
jgi:hypothetical protein